MSNVCRFCGGSDIEGNRVIDGMCGECFMTVLREGQEFEEAVEDSIRAYGGDPDTDYYHQKWLKEKKALDAVKHTKRKEIFSSPLYPGVVFHAIPDPQPDIVEYVRKQTQHEEVTCEVLGNAILFQQEMDPPC